MDPKSTPGSGEPAGSGASDDTESQIQTQHSAEGSADSAKGQTGQDVNTGDAAGEETPEQEREKLLDAVRKVVSPSKEEKAREARSEASTDKTENTDQAKPGTDKQAKTGKQAADDGDPSKDDYLSNEEMAALSPKAKKRINTLWRERQEAREELDTVKPRAEQWNRLAGFLDQSGISDEEAADLLVIGALLKSDPAKAWEKMKPHVEAVQAFLGDKLPDDLRKDVEDGVIPEERARELAALRNSRAFTARRSQETQEQARQREAGERQTALLREINDATVGREAQIAAQDPDYSEVKAPLVADKLAALLQTKGLPRTGKDAVAMFDEAYAAVNAHLGSVRKKFVPERRGQSSKPLNGRSTATDRSQPTDVYAAARLGLERARGVSN